MISNMKILPLIHYLLVLSFFVFFFNTFTTSFSDFEAFDEPRKICKFERFAEVERECSSVLSLASKVRLGDGKIYGTARDLSIHNGDWMQEVGEAPLMPFDDSDMPKNFSSNGSLLKLVSFWPLGVDYPHQTDNAVSVCGLLSIGITRNRTLPYMPDRLSPRFYLRPGYSNQNILFEGLYVNSEENGGEGLMCLLGTSFYPFSEVFKDPFNLLKDCSCIKDDRIMLVLRYPRTFTLTSRAVLGEMRSLNEKSDPKYFDKVHISSQLGYDSKYQFVLEQLVSQACEPYPHQGELVDDRIQIFEGSQFCRAFKMFASEMFDIVSVSKCDGTSKYCNNLGPFMLGSEIGGTNGLLDNFRLTMNRLRCVPGDDINKVKTAKFSAVFRVVSRLEDQYTSEARTGLFGMTISAEGMWNSSSGRLCMVGCVGLETGSNGCNSRICLYLPATFSITQRSIVIGTISSISKVDSYLPLLFKKVLHPVDIWNRYDDYSKSYLSYNYSKIELASAILKRNKYFKLGSLMNQLFLKYPVVEDCNNITSLSLLSDELSLHVFALPDSLFNTQAPKIFVSFEVLSLGPLFGRHRPHLKHSCKGEDTHANTDSVECKLPLNISGLLTLTRNPNNHISKFFLEGLYDPLGGNMYLIGCRDVPESQKFINNTMNLENQMDCSIQVKIEYSSKTTLTRWLVNPTAKISIASQRSEENPLYFSPISLHSFLIPYGNNSREITFRRNFEVIFRILVLLASICCILSQLFYVKKKGDVIPFMSLVMLGFQILGYGFPLIMNTDILFKWKEYHYTANRYYLVGKGMWFRIIDCITKSLLLVAFVLTFRLYQKVSKSRQLKDKAITLKPIPSDKRVFLSTCFIHIIGFLVILITQSTRAENNVHMRINQKLPEWLTELDEYIGLLQDFFLVPQIIGNWIWQIQVKPLSKVYYIGFTVSRFLLRGYDYLRDPVFNSYFHKYDSRSSEVFSKSEDIVIMMMLAALAITVHAQQMWNFVLTRPIFNPRIQISLVFSFREVYSERLKKKQIKFQLHV
ncbi:hypothetical protein F0562_023012 [Nyssa sinensis]|uniref:RING-type E3 ubiquitin transferase n=1 Tax=Nyssa sinensis TaxID=561372 RepID=A0A5J5BHW1_9ASTE|nr:hypothetical protein F0562_023012 [Nyssa sinensis]